MLVLMMGGDELSLVVVMMVLADANGGACGGAMVSMCREWC